MTSLAKEITKIVPFSLNSQSIAAMSTYTKIVSVDRDDWDVAFVLLWNKNQTQNTERVRRMSAFLVLTGDYNEGYSQASYKVTDKVYPYPATLYYYITNHRYAGYSYANDTKLSDVGYDVTGTRVRIERGRINGNNVEIEFKNTWPYLSYIRIEGRIKLVKVVKL